MKMQGEIAVIKPTGKSVDIAPVENETVGE